jgi:hypothetical protein
VYMATTAPIAFPLALDSFWQPRGLGATAPVSTTVEEGAAAALTATASALAIAAATPPSPATPFLLAAAAIATALAKLGVGAGCGQTCIQATNVVNQAEPALLANLQQYEAGEISQAQAQATFNNVWQGIQVSCSAIPGGAGQDCISNRAEGACHWKATGTPPTPYSPPVGSCWNWFNAYYTPLTYPPMTAPSTGTDVTGAVGSAVTSAETSLGISGNTGTLLLLGLAAAVALAVIL